MVPAFVASLHLYPMFTFPSPLAGLAHVYPDQYSQLGVKILRSSGFLRGWEVPLPSGSESGWYEPQPLPLLLLLLRTGAHTELLPRPQLLFWKPRAIAAPALAAAAAAAAAVRG